MKRKLAVIAGAVVVGVGVLSGPAFGFGGLGGGPPAQPGCGVGAGLSEAAHQSGLGFGAAIHSIGQNPGQVIQQFHADIRALFQCGGPIPGRGGGIDICWYWSPYYGKWVYACY